MRGTWQTTEGGSQGALGVAVVIGAAVLIGSGALTAAAAALTSLLEIVLACTVAAVLVVTAVVVVMWRRNGHRLGSVPEQIAALHEAQRLRAVPQRPQRQAIAAPAAHLHYHFHAAPQTEEAPVVLKAIQEGEHSNER